MMDVKAIRGADVGSAIRGADVGSDHHLMLCKLKLKLKKATKEKMEPLYDSRKLLKGPKSEEPVCHGTQHRVSGPKGYTSISH